MIKSWTISVALGWLGCLAAAPPALATPPARSQLLTSAIDQPICITTAPGDTQNLYVCERPGRVRVVDKDSGELAASTILDVSADVSQDGDNGLLGLAFDPAFTTNGYFYIDYIDNANNFNLVRYHLNPGDAAADPDSAYTIWRFVRPFGHNGGWIGFSPTNGNLYISSGDGDTGATPDFAGRAQTIVNQKMGKILRIDPRSDDFPADPDRNYHIPADNPFVAGPGDPEIWSYGVRNPWRCSFDRATGDFYFGDVGNNSWEEIDVEPAASAGGRNYGWPCMEATHCTGTGTCTCNDPGLTLPIYEYPHPIGNSVTGGYVYRGSAIPEFQGRYIFADFIRARVWSFIPGTQGVSDFLDLSVMLTPPTTTTPISWVGAMGEDSDGELYLADINHGYIYKIVPYPCFPVIDAQSGSKTIPQAENVALDVFAAGGDPLTYRWSKDDNDLNDDGHIQGTDTAHLSITNSVQADSGVYKVTITSPCGSVSSDPITLNVRVCGHADFNGNGVLEVQDLFDFLNAWFAGDPATDIDGGGLSVQDIFAFLNSWFLGCA
ncbi:MAG TPA: PQQ-dependent sugar dehydrogenase [Phycisphaerales bacterium]|nr:PQQ-dependent sugar dehydrogenase [Phycisphaerales bacterium]